MTSPKKTKLFGTDGVRGVAGEQLTPDLAMRIGQAAGLKSPGHGGRPALVIVGKDTRRSGYMIEAAVVAGLLSVGADVRQVGPIPTPGLSMLVRAMRADLGVMITASHNTFEYNGIKLFDRDGYKLPDSLEEDIAALVASDLSGKLARGEMIGRAKRIDDALGRYIEFAKSAFPKGLDLTGLRVVLDCAHGAAYLAAPTALHELGADVVTVGVEPNGLNINHGVGSTAPKRLVAMVRERRADIGIALDGDADRVVLADEQGTLIDGDHILAVIANDWKSAGRLTNPTVVGTVMSNLGLERYFKEIGISLIRSAVGDRYVLEEMQRHKATIGGEQSGHIILSEYASTGDGLMAALQVLAAAKKTGLPMSKLAHPFSSVPQVLRNVRYSGSSPMERPSVATAIAEGDRQLAGTGRLLVRLSGTEPLVRVMAEGDDGALVAQVVDAICAEIEASAH